MGGGSRQLHRLQCAQRQGSPTRGQCQKKMQELPKNGHLVGTLMRLRFLEVQVLALVEAQAERGQNGGSEYWLTLN